MHESQQCAKKVLKQCNNSVEKESQQCRNSVATVRKLRRRHFGSRWVAKHQVLFFRCEEPNEHLLQIPRLFFTSKRNFSTSDRHRHRRRRRRRRRRRQLAPDFWCCAAELNKTPFLLWDKNVLEAISSTFILEPAILKLFGTSALILIEIGTTVDVCL